MKNEEVWINPILYNYLFFKRGVIAKFTMQNVTAHQMDGWTAKKGKM